MITSVRKNFVFDINVAHHLEELAKEKKQSMTAFLQDIIEKAYAKIEKRKKLNNFYNGMGLATGLVGETSIQNIKANKYV